MEYHIGTVAVSLEQTGETALHNDFLITPELLTVAREELQTLLGDENAKVAVSVAMSDKYMGSGINVHVSVSLTCNQAGDDIQQAGTLATQLALDQLDTTFIEAMQTWNERPHHD